MTEVVHETSGILGSLLVIVRQRPLGPTKIGSMHEDNLIVV